MSFRKLTPSWRMWCCALGVMAALTEPAYAYLDPVTGSFVIQGLIAGVMAVVAGVRSLRERFLGLFKRRRKDSD